MSFLFLSSPLFSEKEKIVVTEEAAEAEAIKTEETAEEKAAEELSENKEKEEEVLQ